MEIIEEENEILEQLEQLSKQPSLEGVVTLLKSAIEKGKQGIAYGALSDLGEATKDASKYGTEIPKSIVQYILQVADNGLGTDIL